MRKNKLMALFVAVITALQVAAYAEEVPCIEANQVPFTDDINVKVKNVEPNAPISIRITNSEGEKDFYEMGYVNADGTFDFSYVNDRNSGDMYIEAQVGTKRITGSYFKMGDEIYSEFIKAVNDQYALQGTGEPDGEAIKEVFDKYNGKFTLERTAYDNLSLLQQENVYDIMANDSSFKGEIDEFKDVLNAFYAAVLVECYNEDQKTLETMSQVSPYKEIIEADDFAPALVKSIDTASNAVMEEVWESVSDNYTDTKELVQDVEFEIFRVTIKNAGTWNDVKTAFTQYKDILGVDPDDADMNDYKALIGEDFESYEDAESAFKKQIAKVEKEPSKGSGGGGGGGGGNKVTVNAVGAVTVQNPENNNTAQIDKEESGKLIFDDLSEAMWSIKAVTHVYEKGIISGVGNGKFEPNRPITRAEAVKIIIGMLGDSEGGSVPFTDVKETDWAYPYIGAAYRLGIVKGKSETEFDTDSLVTRQEMAVMVYNAIKKNEDMAPATPNIVDKDLIAPWAMDAVLYLYGKNIMVGRLGYVFDPVDSMTRAEAATVIYNVIK